MDTPNNNLRRSKDSEEQMNLDLQKFFIGLMNFFSILLSAALLNSLTFAKGD